MAGRLEGRHVFVTGGSRGIGAAIVEKAQAEGALVSFIDIDAAAGEDLLSRLDARERINLGVGDVRSATDIARVHAAAKASSGQ